MLLALPLTALGDESRDALIVETILRIEGFDLAGSTKAQGAVERYLKNNWAGERYLDLVERFELQESETRQWRFQSGLSGCRGTEARMQELGVVATVNI